MMGSAQSVEAAPGTYAVPVTPPSSDSSAIYRCAASPALVTTADGVQTLYENFQLGQRISGGGPCLGARTRDGYSWLSYDTVSLRSQRAGAALAARGADAGTIIGLYSQNTVEWVLLEQACNAYSLVSVPLYDTLGEDAVAYIMGVTDMRMVACSSDKTRTLLAAATAARTPLALVIELDGVTPSRVQEGVTILSLDALEAEGAAAGIRPRPPRPSDVATLVFTSGTTSTPKGVTLTHGNFACAMAGAAASGVDLRASDVHLSYLPLAHVFERLVQACVIHRGASIGFFNGDVQRLLEDMAVLKPTLFPSVPRLFNRVHDKIMAGVHAAPAARRQLFHFALSSKLHYLRADGSTSHTLYDTMVFSKLRALLGGRVRLMITGSAPLAQGVKEFFQVVFSAPMLEGYGLSETCGVATLTSDAARVHTGVGGPVSCNELKVVDIPEMKYLHTDDPWPRGEVCIRGGNVFAGYYKGPALTAEAIDADGFFHTGDVGTISPAGLVRIIDRKKNIFKLSQGEYVAPDKIEGVYTRCPLVAQIFVHGDSLKSQLVAVVVPDADAARVWAHENGLSPDSPLAELVQQPTFTKSVMTQMAAEAARAGLKGFECVRAIHLDAAPFTLENGLLTPTFKLKRAEAMERYASDITRMYATLGE